MSIYKDKPTGRWRFDFDRYVGGLEAYRALAGAQPVARQQVRGDVVHRPGAEPEKSGDGFGGEHYSGFSLIVMTAIPPCVGKLQRSQSSVKR